MKRCQAHEELGSRKLRVYRKAADVRHIHRTYDCRRSRTELWKKKVTVAAILAGLHQQDSASRCKNKQRFQEDLQWVGYKQWPVPSKGPAECIKPA